MRSAILISILLLSSPPAFSQSFGDILNGIFGSQTETEEKSNSSMGASALSELDVEAGLKEALVLGAQAVGSQLSQTNGYFGDNNIQIPLPGRLAKVQSQLKRFGLSGPLDDLQLSLNRAAETAAPQAADLVVTAVQSLTVEDAFRLLEGGDTAATDLLRFKTEADLRVLARPYMESALANSGTIDAFDGLASNYGLSQYSEDLKTQLIDSAVNEGLDGLFFYLAREEQAIRKNPVKRTTDLLRRVFGG